MITFKAALYSRPNKEGKYPLLIRICEDRKYTPWYLGRAIAKKEWDKESKRIRKNHTNSKRLNALLTSKIAQADELYLQLSLAGFHLTRKELLTLLKSNASAEEYIKAQTEKAKARKQEVRHFFSHAQDYLNNLKVSGKYNQYVTDKPRVERLKTFLLQQKKVQVQDKVVVKDVPFQELTVSLLKNFKAYLKGTYKISERTCINYLIVVRTIYNLGIKSRDVSPEFYPFGKGKIPIKFPDSKKIGLTQKELNTIIKLDLSKYPKIAHARNKWLISYYFAGARISDVLRLRWKDVVDGRLYYTMGKNRKSESLKIIQDALAIFDQYKSDLSKPDDLIFPDLKTVHDFNDKYLVQRKISYAVKHTNTYLKKLAEKAKIDKKLTNHIARHTFGNISGNKIPIGILQILYRHADVTTTINYQRSFMNEDIDSALESVVGKQNPRE